MPSFNRTFTILAGGVVVNAFDGDPIENPPFRGAIRIWGVASATLPNATLRIDSETPFINYLLNVEVAANTVDLDRDLVGKGLFLPRSAVVLRLENPDVATRQVTIKAESIQI